MNTHKDRTPTLFGTIRMPLLLVATATLLLVAGEAEAQIGFGVEGRAGVTFPSGDLSDRGAETGLTVGAELQANFHPNLTAYAGLHRHGFRCEDDCSLGDNPRSTGIGAGLKFIFHNPGDVLWWGRGGVVGNTLSTDDGSSDRGIGFEAGVGADMPIGHRLYLVPNVGFISHDWGEGRKAAFFTLGVGLHLHIN